MMKERFDLIASSLSSYFGVGFNDPMTQLDIDLGIIAQEFDEVAEDRMRLGRHMEDASLNYFEEALGIVIDERNSEYAYAFNGMLKCKRDGRTFYEGEETGVENKYSNSTQHCFTDDFGYVIQCHGYMEAWNLNQWLLLGMWQGRPVKKLIKRDNELMKDIEEMVECVYGILTGILDREDFRWDIVEKYSKTVQLKELTDEDVEDYDKELLRNLAELKEIEKDTKSRIDEISDYIKKTYQDSKYNDGLYTYSISTGERAGGYDMEALSIEHPEIDLSKYRKESNLFKTIRCTKNKSAK